MMFASELHVMPWNVGRLSNGQIMAAKVEFDAMIEARSKQQ